jgi:hypothetical protein
MLALGTLVIAASVAPLPPPPMSYPVRMEHRVWYLEEPYVPAPGELKIDGAVTTLDGPFRSRDSCETAHLNSGDPKSTCHYYRRIPIVQYPPIPIQTDAAAPKR